MRYRDFEKEIKLMASSASEAARLRFARDTIQRLHHRTADALRDELSMAENQLLTEILNDLERNSLATTRSRLEFLNESMCRDEVRAIEFSPDLTELLCAVESRLDYADTGDTDAIARIAINMVNSIDYAIGGDSDSYSTENILGAQEMRDEYQRQQQLLAGA